MRLITTFNAEKQAYAFYAFLLKERIQSLYEPFPEQGTQEKRYRLWIYDEEDLEAALEWLERYQKNPEDPQFQNVQIPLTATPHPFDPAAQKQGPPLSSRRRRFPAVLTHVILGLCIFLFLWNSLEEAEIIEDKGALAALITFTPLQKVLLFDYTPSSFQYIDMLLAKYDLKPYKDLKELPADAQELMEKAEKAPVWQGIYSFLFVAHAPAGTPIPLFEKIRQGEVWRLFTPCLLHRDFLHLLFNMAWLWLLGRQIEERIRPGRTLLLVLVLGIFSNTLQYLMSGPYFLGFSGVAVGMAGFIWMRQRKAPWEGYPLNKGTVLFLLLFVLSMCVLEVVTFGLELFSVIQVAPTIANTAHIAGGLCGILLGRSSLFVRKVP